MNTPDIPHTVDVEAFFDAVQQHPVRIIGQLLEASNAAFFAWAGPVPVIYKPVRGERPLWDFPDGHLAHRERASYLIDAAAGFGIVSPTALVDGPAGVGAVQRWVTDPDRLLAADGQGSGHEDAGASKAEEVDESDEAHEADDDSIADDEVDDESVPDDTLFALLDPGAPTAPWLPVCTAELPDGRKVVLAHADDPTLRSVAVLDAVLNNSDRKGSHLLRSPGGHLWGIDHGVTLHRDPKLRTVLWGWAGEDLPDADVVRLQRLNDSLVAGGTAETPLRRELGSLLTPEEIDALSARVSALLREGTHPLPRPGWPAVPWPAL